MVIKKKTIPLFNERFDEFQIMNEIQRAKIIHRPLNKLYPKIVVPLHSRKVLVACKGLKRRYLESY